VRSPTPSITCNNWTSDAMTLPQQNPNIPADRARAMLGHSDRSGECAENPVS